MSRGKNDERHPNCAGQGEQQNAGPPSPISPASPLSASGTSSAQAGQPHANRNDERGTPPDSPDWPSIMARLEERGIRLEERSVRFERVLMWVAVVGLVVAIVQGWTSYKQWQTMLEQTKQTENSFKIAERATKAAEDQAEVARKQFAAAQESAKESAALALEAHEATIRSADAADRANVIANDAMKRQLRPNIAILPMTVAETNPTQLQVRLSFANVGRTAANNLLISTTCKLETKVFKDFVPDTSLKPTKVFIGPGTQYNDSILVRSGEAEKRQIRSGHVLWVFGKASYTDDFGENHETDYRFYYDFARKLFLTAEEGNASRTIGRTEAPLVSPPVADEPPKLRASAPNDRP